MNRLLSIFVLCLFIFSSSAHAWSLQSGDVILIGSVINQGWTPGKRFVAVTNGLGGSVGDQLNTGGGQSAMWVVKKIGASKGAQINLGDRVNLQGVGPNKGKYLCRSGSSFGVTSDANGTNEATWKFVDPNYLNNPNAIGANGNEIGPVGLALVSTDLFLSYDNSNATSYPQFTKSPGGLILTKYNDCPANEIPAY